MRDKEFVNNQCATGVDMDVGKRWRAKCAHPVDTDVGGNSAWRDYQFAVLWIPDEVQVFPAKFWGDGREDRIWQDGRLLMELSDSAM